MSKIIHFNAFEMNCVGHQSPGLWSHPRDRSAQYKDLEYETDLAKIISSASLAQNVRFHQATERCCAQYRYRRCDTTPSTHSRYEASRARWAIRAEGADCRAVRRRIRPVR